MHALSNQPKFNPQIHHRRSIRLQDYNYTQSGAYYITIYIYQKECMFGTVVNGEIVLNVLGNIIQTEWLKSAEIRSEIEIGEFVVMPNHIHGIIVIQKPIQANDNDKELGVSGVGAYGHTPLRHAGIPSQNVQQSNPPTLRSPSKTMGAMVRGFKSCATIKNNQTRNTPRVPVWQRNYYEHIIRDEADY
jgi:putative transposase